MKIELHEIKIEEIVNGYVNNDEEGVVGYGGRLNIRPKYQREFVYDKEKRDAVIDTVHKGYPLNIMYWVCNDDGSFEVLDGQQRTISICEYVIGHYSINGTYFHSLTIDQQRPTLDYKLMIYFCAGVDSEKLEWFRTVNIAGEKLLEQELRNAIYTGEWLTDAKKWFSKSGGPAYQIAGKYLRGSAIRQDYLETAISWINGNGDEDIRRYMSKHQYDDNAKELWDYFQGVITWVQTVFPIYRKEMKGLEWGELYNKYKDLTWNGSQLESEVSRLMQDEDVDSKSGIYLYLLSCDEKYLNLRGFPDKIKRETYERQDGICTICGKRFMIEQMEADHITPWCEGGHTDAANCQMLCRECNRRKGKR